MDLTTINIPLPPAPKRILLCRAGEVSKPPLSTSAPLPNFAQRRCASPNWLILTANQEKGAGNICTAPFAFLFMAERADTAPGLIHRNHMLHHIGLTGDCPRLRMPALQSINHIHPRGYPSNNRILPVKEITRLEHDEKLAIGAIGTL